MILPIQTYVRRGRHTLRRLMLDPRLHTSVRAGAYFLAGLVLSAASLAHMAQPFAMGLVCACCGWSAVLTAGGAACGYLLFWGSAGQQGVIWVGAALLAALTVARPRQGRDAPLLLPALGGLIVAATGVLLQTWGRESPAIPVYLLRVALGAGSGWLFAAVLRGRNPVLEWLTYGIGVLALAQIMPLPYVGLGYIAGGMLAVAGSFPAAALAGLALDLSQVTPVPMTAVLCGAYLWRFLPRYPRWAGCAAPALTYLLLMSLGAGWDVMPLAGLLIGGFASLLLPAPTKLAHRRGETGAAQVRLEMVAGVLAQTEQLLLEAPVIPVDEEALVARAAERACGSCPCRKSCKDTRRIGQLPSPVLYKPLLTPEELPIVCRKSGRFLAELHRSQEQLRSIRADRERQKEYRAAVVQQYQFLSAYLQSLSDQLSHRSYPGENFYRAAVHVYGNRPKADNGDLCVSFPGTLGRHYVLLCDGMGTGMGAVQEAKTAANLLRTLLSAGYPAEHALRSINSLCALRDRAGAVTVDLAELFLDSGKTVLYKWGAVPSYLVSRFGVEKLGTVGPPPGICVTDCQEMTYTVSLRRGEMLVMVSDGISETDALRCCADGAENAPALLAARLLSTSRLTGQDDTTAVLIRLEPMPPHTER